jgi:hypothetical protein
MSSQGKVSSPVLASLASLCLLAAPSPLRAAWVSATRSAVCPTNAHLAQEEEMAQTDDSDVPPQDVEKYIKVYKAMQQNRNLTVEQAAAQQGLTVSAFRSLEDRIERNDALREHVREALKPNATASPAQ